MHFLIPLNLGLQSAVVIVSVLNYFQQIAILILKLIVTLLELTPILTVLEEFGLSSGPRGRFAFSVQ